MSNNTAIEKFSPQKCERCGAKLNEKAIVWLELSQSDGLYYDEIPQGHKSQGAFPFGKDCAREQLNDTRFANQVFDQDEMNEAFS
jgi:hypothetical protein